MGKLGLLLVAIMASGCATLHTPPNVDPENYRPVTQEKSNYYSDPPGRGKVYAAVYSYADLTGQRAQGTQTLSTAVTQGGANYLISALSDYSDRSWFRVVERQGIDNLVKINQTNTNSIEDILKNKMDVKLDDITIYASDIEEKLFKNSKFIENNIITNKHQLVNVYNVAQKKYIVRESTSAIDIQFKS